ncbi:MAG: GTPase RsgA [Firmicutes bacterium]|nr:GTPase RsgA [Bacillota bacterium]
MNKCVGCGELTNQELCERCFRIKNYNDYKVVSKTNNDFIPILESIDEKDLVVLVVDLFNIGDLSLFRKYLKNDILLVLTKRDLLPKSLYEEKLLNYDYKIDYIDKIIISSEKNYNYDLLLDKINKYKKSNNVYVVGYTNAGKSTMINKLLYNYSSNKTIITTSPLPSTTLNTIEIKLDEQLTLFDTPGLLDEKDIINKLDSSQIKKVIPKKEIKPITYQIKDKQILIIDEFLRIEANDIDLTFFVSNLLEIKRYYKDIDYMKDYNKKDVEVNNNDIVIKGLGFIKTNKKSKVTIYTLDGVDVFTRDSLI